MILYCVFINDELTRIYNNKEKALGVVKDFCKRDSVFDCKQDCWTNWFIINDDEDVYYKIKLYNLIK